MALEAGSDFIKTSTGKGSAGAELPSFIVMLLALRDFMKAKNVKGRGIKAAGGIRDGKTAI